MFDFRVYDQVLYSTTVPSLNSVAIRSLKCIIVSAMMITVENNSSHSIKIKKALFAQSLCITDNKLLFAELRTDHI